MHHLNPNIFAKISLQMLLFEPLGVILTKDISNIYQPKQKEKTSLWNKCLNETEPGNLTPLVISANCWV